MVGGRPVQRDRDDRTADFAGLVPLVDAPDLRAVGGEHEVGVAQRGSSVGSGACRAGGRGRVGRERTRCLLPVGHLRPGDVQALIGVVGEDDRMAARHPAAAGGGLGSGPGDRDEGPPAVLVHPGAGIPRGRQQHGPPPAGAAVHDSDPAAFLRPSFLPPDVAADHHRKRDMRPAAGDFRS